MALKKYPPSAYLAGESSEAQLHARERNCTHLPRYRLVRDGVRRSLGRLGPRGGRCACRCERESCRRPSQVAQAPCRSPHRECFLNDTSVSLAVPIIVACHRGPVDSVGDGVIPRSSYRFCQSTRVSFQSSHGHVYRASSTHAHSPISQLPQSHTQRQPLTGLGVGFCFTFDTTSAIVSA